MEEITVLFIFSLVNQKTEHSGPSNNKTPTIIQEHQAKPVSKYECLAFFYSVHVELSTCTKIIRIKRAYVCKVLQIFIGVAVKMQVEMTQYTRQNWAHVLCTTKRTAHNHKYTHEAKRKTMAFLWRTHSHTISPYRGVILYYIVQPNERAEWGELN